MTPSLTLTFLCATFATALAGLLPTHLMGGSKLPWPFRLALSYGIGIVLVSQLLMWTSAPSVSLSQLSWNIVVGLLLLGTPFIVMAINHHRRDSISRAPLINSVRKRIWFGQPDFGLKALLLALLMLHCWLILSNNLSRTIFPWDAFTTWMYRAKLWVLQDNLSTFMSVPNWLSAGGASGFAIYADKYPPALSVYAAFISALTGGWQPAIVGLVWCSLFIALCLLISGLLKALGCSNRLALCGTYLTGSLPLLNIHAALAGYGDLWMAFFSGGGLALLLVWHVNNDHRYLPLAAALLLAGAQIKSEGWLWLLMGVAFFAITWSSRLRGYSTVALVLITLTLLLWLTKNTTFSFGFLGTWGADESQFYAGSLGVYPLRPYDPAGNYFDIIFRQFNFLLLGSAYCAALISLTWFWREKAAPFWIMGGMIAFSQYVIFGLSVYSQYAETGTAITRLLVHFIPVVIVTTVLGWQALTEAMVHRFEAGNGRGIHLDWRNQRVAGIAILVAVAGAAIPLGITALSMLPNQPVVTISEREDFKLIVGELAGAASGLQFSDSPVPVGVVAGPQWDATKTKPRFLLSDTAFENVGDLSFYWIQEGSDAVQSTTVSSSGQAITDLGRFSAWSEHAVKEYGYIVQKAQFDTTRIYKLSLESALSVDSFPALFNQWTRAESLSHRIINNTVGHSAAPIALAGLLNTAFLSVTVLGCLLLIIWPHRRLLQAIGLGLILIWICADSISLKNSALHDLSTPTGTAMNIGAEDPAGWSLNRLSHAINTAVETNRPLLIVSLDAAADFASQKLPFLMLPRPAVSLVVSHDKGPVSSWEGALVVVGSDESALDQYGASLAESGAVNRRLSWQTEGVRVFMPE